MNDTVKKQPKRPKKGLITAGIVVGIILLTAVVYYLTRQPASPSAGQVTPQPKAAEGEETQPTTTAGSPSPIPTSTKTQASQDGQVTLSAPTQGSTVTSGTKVSGTVKTAGNRVYYRLKGAKSGQLALGTIEVPGAANGPVPFSFDLAFTNQVAEGGDQGVLEVYTTDENEAEESKASVMVNIEG